jgi:anti-sigma factor ChrR (cupin superfamily)
MELPPGLFYLFAQEKSCRLRFEDIMLRCALKNLIKIKLDESTLGKLLWKDFGNGLSMAKLAREGARELVLYRTKADADPRAFLRHEHIGGEFYLVLKGSIADETGIYEEGDIVYLDPSSVHTPRAVGETVVLVLWPEGVRILD